MTTVPGLGEVPYAWSVERAKWLLTRQRRSVRPEDDIVTAFRDGQVTLRSNRRTDGFTNAIHEIGYQGIRKGDLVVHGMDGFAGAIGVSDSDGKASPVVHTYVPNETVDARYMAYVLRTMAMSGYVATLAKGIRERSTAFDAPTLANVQLPVPPLEEQRRIADFLGAETARIDRLIHLQGLVVEKLDERERAQLDSAIDELINRWGSVPLRRFLRGVDQGTSPQADAYPAGPNEWGVLKVSCLRPGRFFPDENKRLPQDLEPDIKHEVRPGDLLITRANTPQLVGSAAVVHQIRGKLLLSDKIFRVHIDQRMTAEFVATVARGSRIRDLCAASSNGASQSMANIRFEEVKGWPLPAASLDAQHDLVRRVDRQRSVLDSLRTKVERQARLLTERRQALITAAVTGQFDVSTASGRNVTEGVTV